MGLEIRGCAKSYYWTGSSRAAAGTRTVVELSHFPAMELTAS